MQVEAYVKALTIEEKIGLMSETAKEVERLGIKRYHHGNEALHGVVRPGKFTVFPQAIAMAASFHPALLEMVAEAISDEARARHNENNGEMLGGDFDGLYNGLLTFWSPNLNVARDPRWGRTGETYGEDPYLIGVCGNAFVKGLQGDKKNNLKTIATPKHFVGNNEEHNRFECNANIPRDLYFDYYLAPFEDVVKEAKCESIMVSYNAVNKIPCHASGELLNDILRKRWGFEGYVVSDCGAISHLLDRHYYVKSPQEAAAEALKAGVDLECGSCGTIIQVYSTYLKQALEENLIIEEDINQAVTRILHGRDKLGILGVQKSSYDHLEKEIIGCEKHQKLALKMAEESVVLLKNDFMDGDFSYEDKEILPLNQKKLRICVVGNQADKHQFGDYSGHPVHAPISILDGIREQWDETKIVFVPFEKEAVTERFGIIDGSCLFHEEGNQLIRPGLYGNYQNTSRIDSVIDFEWENMAPDPLIPQGAFSIQWEGFLIPPADGVYEFAVQVNEKECKCQGKYQIYINNNSVHLSKIKLKKKEKYAIFLSYENSGIAPSIRLLWRIGQWNKEERFERERKAAKDCDLIVACVGLGTEYEAEGRDKMDLNLPREQMDLLKAVWEVNSNLIVTLYNGSSLTIPWIAEHAKGILECWYPGEQGGRAIANILFGNVSPSGKLPLTFYEDVNDLPSFQCYDIRKGLTYSYAHKVRYPFGYGLSYTTFSVKDYSVKMEDGKMKGKVFIKNEGNREGKEVVQIYTRYLEEKDEPIKLSFIEKINFEVGEEKEITFCIPMDRLKAYDVNKDDRIVRPGCYEVCVCKDAKTMIRRNIVEWKQ